jgi:hypothetical protein
MSTNADTSKGSRSRRPLRLHKPVLSLDHITTARTPKSSGEYPPTERVILLNNQSLRVNVQLIAQSSVFARLQARLLPHAATPPPLPTASIHAGAPEKPPPPKYLKIRIITWNMNESLPKVSRYPTRFGRLFTCRQLIGRPCCTSWISSTLSHRRVLYSGLGYPRIDPGIRPSLSPCFGVSPSGYPTSDRNDNCNVVPVKNVQH